MFAGVAVSAVTATSDGDVSRLHWLPWRTGGDAPWADFTVDVY